MLQAVRYLTIVPIGDPNSPGKSVMLFPLIGAGLGWLGARGLVLATPWLGNALAVLLVLMLWTALTGARQELGVLKTLGQLGTIAIVFLEILRWHSITRLTAMPMVELIAALAVSRTAIVAIAWLSRPVGDGIRLGTHMTTIGAVFAIALGLGFAFAAGKQGVVMAMLTGLVTSLLVQWFDQNRGGVDTHGLHGSSLFIETLALVILSCRNCFW